MTSSIIFWYIIGVIISLIGLFLYEHLYLYDKQLHYITKKEIFKDITTVKRITKEILEDCLLSLLSWLTVLLLLVSISIDFYLKWPSKGYELNRKKSANS